MAEFPVRSGKEAQEHFHEGHEFFYVVDGSLILRFQAEDHLLSAGDSFYFDSYEPHSYRGTSDPCARAVAVTLPPQP